MSKELKYDAFISYRHNDLDKFVATNLHRLLETYKLPKSIIKSNNLEKTKIERVFRDQEELPLASSLEDPIIEALKNSEFLIVICSPRLKESMWCKKEIETFIKLHGRSKVLAVLVEGEPADSFPKELLYDEKTKKAVEPLALDCRGNSKAEVLKNLKQELLRLIAPMFNLNYDDLKRRHHERKVKNIIRISVASSIVLLLFLIYMSVNLIIIKNKQNTILNLWSVNLADESNTDYYNDNRSSAILKAYQGLTKYDGMRMPETSEAQFSLTQALDPYDIGYTVKADKQIDTVGIAKHMKVSANKKILVYDTSNTLTLIDEDFKVKKEFRDLASFLYSDYCYSFLPNKTFGYFDKDYKFVIRDYNGKLIKTLNKGSNVYSSNDYIVLSSINEMTIYDAKYKEVYSYKTKKDIDLNIEKEVVDKYLIFSEEPSLLNSSVKKNSITFHILNIETKELKTIELPVNLGTKYIVKDNILYLLSNSYNNGNDYLALYKINLKTADKIWELKIDNAFSTLFGLNSKGSNIYVATSSTGYIIGADDGKIEKTVSIGSEVIQLYNYPANDNYFVMTNKGNYYTVGSSLKEAIQIAELYHFNLDSYLQFELLDGNFVAIPSNDTRVILYKARDNKKEEIKKYDFKATYLKTSDIEKNINKYPSMKKDLVSGYVKINDKGVIIFSFNDNTMEVYDIKEKKLIKKIDNAIDEVTDYLGTDKSGNVYLTDGLYGIVLNEKYEKIAKINNLIGLDKKNNKVIVYKNDKYYKISILSVKDLKKMAKKYID